MEHLVALKSDMVSAWAFFYTPGIPVPEWVGACAGWAENWQSFVQKSGTHVLNIGDHMVRSIDGKCTLYNPTDFWSLFGVVLQ